MPTKNPRINITMDPDTTQILSDIANQEKKSLSAVAQELIIESLERREDRAFSKIAESRDTDKAKRVSHEKAWK